VFKSIRLRNILSFGPEGMEVDLRPLNILIGPNGVGKSNLIEAVSLLRSLPRDFAEPIRQGGGIAQWLHKSGGGAGDVRASIEVVVGRIAGRELLHHIAVVRRDDRPEISGEHMRQQEAKKVDFLYDFVADAVTVVLESMEVTKELKAVTRAQSVLAQFRDPVSYPQFTDLADSYASIRIYRDWSFGRHSPVRVSQRTDERNDFLAEDMRNLGLILNGLRRNPAAKRRVLDALEHLYPDISDFDVSIAGGMIEVFLQEGGVEIPASRLSDGTLRFLCLLAVLCHPTPPPLVCIEEPELGLHPDMMPEVADLLREASERCQLIVTTHSSALIDAFTHEPECVLVCEKTEANSTSIRRLDAERLEGWLKDYSLGNLWSMGAIGGNRW